MYAFIKLYEISWSSNMQTLVILGYIIIFKKHAKT